MLTNQTQTILKSLLNINNSLIISYPKMIIIDEFKSIPGMIDLSKLEEPFEEFGIFDGAKFLSALEMFTDPSITLKDNIIYTKDQNSDMKYVVSDPSSLEDCTIDEDLIATTVAAPSILEFQINTEMINKIKKASSVFKTMDALFLIKNDNDILLEVGSKNNFHSSDNSYSIKMTPDVSNNEDLKLAIPLENILKLPTVNYNVMVKYNKNNGDYRIVLQNDIYTFMLSLMK